MLRAVVAPLVALALLAASPDPSHATSLTVTCQHAHLYLFLYDQNRPIRAREPDVTLGQRFGLVRGPRTTLEGQQYYETDIPVVEPGYPQGAHYWISRDCVNPTR
ncbi:MAG TPA: hypothetical protein VE591_09095 [Candidatus Acidoferrum sp.]|nr:hypothetical protein [Candidatus Acidoferrum sp.]